MTEEFPDSRLSVSDVAFDIAMKIMSAFSLLIVQPKYSLTPPVSRRKVVRALMASRVSITGRILVSAS